MTHGEFLASRRLSNFKAEYTQEENAYWMEQAVLQANKNASGYRFPASLEAQRVLDIQKLIDDSKGRHS